MEKLAPYSLKLVSFTWYSSVLLLLAAGWAMRDHNYIVAESGIGYWFGIIGGGMMLLLLIYPLRKRFRSWAAIGSIKSWFRIHMILGVAGPMMIIFHSGFELGSFNSSVAFFSMLTVAISGLVGRWLYQRIHHGLYGRKVKFEDLYTENELPEILMNSNGDLDFGLVEEFEDIEQQLTHRHTGENRSIGFYLRMKSRLRALSHSVRKSDIERRDKKRLFRRLLDLRAICRLGINEILFSYWHVLHLPLFIMLVLSGLIHVAVVHLY